MHCRPCTPESADPDRGSKDRALVRGGAANRPAIRIGFTACALNNLTRFNPGIFSASDKASVLLFGIVSGVLVGIFEELGWTGFAVPRMTPLHGVFSTLTTASDGCTRSTEGGWSMIVVEAPGTAKVVGSLAPRHS